MIIWSLEFSLKFPRSSSTNPVSFNERMTQGFPKPCAHKISFHRTCMFFMDYSESTNHRYGLCKINVINKSAI